MTFDEIRNQTALRLNATNACLRVEHAISQHILPVVGCGIIVGIFGFFFNVAVILLSLGLLLALASAGLYFMAEACKATLNRIWLSHFEKVKWTTAVGEAINIKEMTPDGLMAHVQFSDGEVVMYPTSLLKPVQNNQAASLLPSEGRSTFSEVEWMLKQQWKAPSGEIGSFRSFEFISLEKPFSTKIRLRLTSGKDAVFFQTQLTEACE